MILLILIVDNTCVYIHNIIQGFFLKTFEIEIRYLFEFKNKTNAVMSKCSILCTNDILYKINFKLKIPCKINLF